ncbi:sodium-coupled monocarboxylate transporter 2-like [Argopecten irradians]|uniref:sodium-coupled monocarboxylate transporter 2-like n=1 Tax=Argopecten irradians TaxID=31199 RepID=UPI00371FB941
MSPAGGGFMLVDYIVFVCFILISIGIGVYYGIVGRSSSVEYHLGKRRIQTFPLILSMLVTSQSSILMLGIPTETYLYGGVVLWASAGLCLAFLIGARIVVPMLFPLKLTTVAEYFQLRYKGKAVRLFIATCILLLNVSNNPYMIIYLEIYIGVIVMAQSVAMEKVTRIPSWVSILAVFSSAILYTALGGIKAVIWTDVFQCVVMVTGILSVLIKGTMDAGGSAYVWEVNTATDRLDVFNFDPDPLVPYTIWSFVIGGTLKFMFNALKQTAVQRMNSCQTQNEATLVYLITGPLYLVSVSLACGEGLVAYAYFTAKGCDPFVSKLVTNPNQLIPVMVVELFRDYPGMSGMFLAAVTAATLSSVSSSLAGMSSTTHEDIIKPHYPRMSDAIATRLSRISVVVYGGVGVLIAFLTAELPGSVFKVATSLMSVFGVPLTGIFLCSIFCPSVTQISVLAGGVVSGCLMFWINLGSAFTVKHNPRLQPVPIDQCWNFTLGNNTISANNDDVSRSRPEGLDAVYSLSYLWFDTLGFLGFVLVICLVRLVLGKSICTLSGTCT